MGMTKPPRACCAREIHPMLSRQVRLPTGVVLALCILCGLAMLPRFALPLQAHYCARGDLPSSPQCHQHFDCLEGCTCLEQGCDGDADCFSGTIRCTYCTTTATYTVDNQGRIGSPPEIICYSNALVPGLKCDQRIYAATHRCQAVYRDGEQPPSSLQEQAAPAPADVSVDPSSDGSCIAPTSDACNQPVSYSTAVPANVLATCQNLVEQLSENYTTLHTAEESMQTLQQQAQHAQFALAQLDTYPQPNAAQQRLVYQQQLADAQAKLQIAQALLEQIPPIVQQLQSQYQQYSCAIVLQQT
jgi:hypothetical protein